MRECIPQSWVMASDAKAGTAGKKRVFTKHRYGWRQSIRVNGIYDYNKFASTDVRRKIYALRTKIDHFNLRSTRILTTKDLYC